MKNKLSEYASAMGKIGGKSKSPAKAAASRLNGLRGGRPVDPNSARQKKIKKDLTEAKRLAII